jgi:hypothetical protein
VFAVFGENRNLHPVTAGFSVHVSVLKTFAVAEQLLSDSENGVDVGLEVEQIVGHR